MAWNLFKLASYGKFGFSRSDLDGNKLVAKGMCLSEIEKCLSNCTDRGSSIILLLKFLVGIERVKPFTTKFLWEFYCLSPFIILYFFMNK